MGIDRNTYVVELRKSIGCVRLTGYRQMGRRKRQDYVFIPYALAMFLGLLPTEHTFTNKLYGFLHKDLDDLDVHGPITRVTRKGASVFVTIDMSLV